MVLIPSLMRFPMGSSLPGGEGWKLARFFVHYKTHRV
jgi:hypothetical protein